MSVEAFKDKHIAGTPVIKDGYIKHFYGEICYSTVCPGDGWVECDGTNGTVDIRETRLFGVPDEASLGQRINDAVGSHRHSVNILLTNSDSNIDRSFNAVGLQTEPGQTQTINYDLTTVIGAKADYTRSKTYYVKTWMYIGG